MYQAGEPSPSIIKQGVVSLVLGDCLELCRVRKDDLPRQVERCTVVQLEKRQWESVVMTIFKNMKNSYRKATTNRKSRGS